MGNTASFPRRQPDRFLPDPKLHLREQLHEVMRFFEQFSLRTESAYWAWIKQFIRFCREHPRLTPALSPPPEGAERGKDWWHPANLGVAEVKAFLEDLAGPGIGVRSRLDG